MAICVAAHVMTSYTSLCDGDPRKYGLTLCLTYKPNRQIGNWKQVNNRATTGVAAALNSRNSLWDHSPSCLTFPFPFSLSQVKLLIHSAAMSHSKLKSNWGDGPLGPARPRIHPSVWLVIWLDYEPLINRLHSAWAHSQCLRRRILTMMDSLKRTEAK